MRNLMRSFFIGVLAALAMACGSGAPDEEKVLISLTDFIIVPGYEAVADATGELRQSLDSLCADPSLPLWVDARQTWRDARTPWMRSEATWFGPVMDRRSVRG